MRNIKSLILLLLTPLLYYAASLLLIRLINMTGVQSLIGLVFFANFCTVIITFMIAIRAKRFLDEKVHNEGLVRGYKILDTIDEIVDTLPSLMLRTISNDEVVQMASNPNKNYENYSLESAMSNAGKIYWKINEIQIKLKKVEFMIKRLNRWHVDIKHTGVSLDIENYCTLRSFFDLPTLAGRSRRNLPEAGIRLLFQI